MPHPFYKTTKWERKRKAILRRDGYMCRECRRYGRTTPANTVHHIVPLEDRPDLALDDRNLISLCEECHNGMHDRHTGRLTTKGLAWVNRMGLGARVVLVWGPPASGKTTYVREHMRDGDMVVDLDRIKEAISMRHRSEVSDELLPVALSIREHIYGLIERREIPLGTTVWVIAGLADMAERDEVIRRLKPDRMVQMETPKDECIRRALADPERPDKARQVQIILRWFEKFAR